MCLCLAPRSAGGEGPGGHAHFTIALALYFRGRHPQQRIIMWLFLASEIPSHNQTSGTNRGAVVAGVVCLLLGVRGRLSGHDVGTALVEVLT